MSAGQGIDVGTIAQTTLAAVVAHFAASEVELPERRVIAPGDTRAIAWDCESILVTTAGIGWGQAQGQGGGARQTGNPVSATAVRHTVIALQIVRPVPEGDSGEPPDADELTAAGLALMRDAGLLSQALVEVCGRDGPLKRAGSAVPGAVVMVGPDGGYAAAEGSLEITASQLT